MASPQPRTIPAAPGRLDDAGRVAAILRCRRRVTDT
jgi:hypothetical protein